MPDIGELVVGVAVEVQGYDFVVYNHRPGKDLPEDFAPAGLAGVSARLGELDVLGLNTNGRTAYLAECRTHLDGLPIGKGPEDAVRKLSAKLAVAGAYGKVLEGRTGLKPELSVWSPRVPRVVVNRWPEIQDRAGRSAGLVANDDDTERVRRSRPRLRATPASPATTSTAPFSC